MTLGTELVFWPSFHHACMRNVTRNQPTLFWLNERPCLCGGQKRVRRLVCDVDDPRQQHHKLRESQSIELVWLLEKRMFATP